MVRFGKLINAAAFGGALLFSGAAIAQEYNYFYPMVTAKGLYYAPGTPVLHAQGPVTPTGASAGLGAPPPLLWSSSGMVPAEPLMTGRSVAVGTVGNHCLTPEKTCLLYHSSTQGGGCACKVTGRWRHGTVAP